MNAPIKELILFSGITLTSFKQESWKEVGKEVYASIETQKMSKSPECNIWLIPKAIKEIQF